jgi:hypothetical protein
MVKGQTVMSDTCYTDDALIKIKNAYNKNQPKTKIKTKNPKQIFKELKHRLKNCNKEDCWLNLLPEKEKEYMDKYLFAPDQPKEWSKNPNEWLSNYDILNVLKQYEQKYPHFAFIGPTTIDFNEKLPELNDNCVENALCNFDLKKYIERSIDKIGIIFNLDRHDQSGSHWVSLFIDIQHKIIFYFDSAGSEIPEEINDFVLKVTQQGVIKKIKFKFYQNYPTTHQESSTECGMYSLFFIITMLTGNTEFHQNMSLKKKISLFKNEKIQDKYVEKLRNIYFNK